ncbi:MAG: DUF2853 family protein [Rhodoblastus sp.]|nr:MAG: DUF2853 family protein [Rhodoblastus sp.]
MSQDYAADVKKYAPKADDAVIGKIVKHLGIALRNRDSSLVSCTDPDEVKRVKESWCLKKLGADADASDAAIKAVCEQMKADKAKSRVTFYYLCAEKLGKLGVLA